LEITKKCVNVLKQNLNQKDDRSGSKKKPERACLCKISQRVRERRGPDSQKEGRKVEGGAVRREIKGRKMNSHRSQNKSTGGGAAGKQVERNRSSHKQQLRKIEMYATVTRKDRGKTSGFLLIEGQMKL